MVSPRKYASAFTSSTSNRGVEAREIEVANTRLDTGGASSCSAPAPPPPAPNAGDDTDSYVQVVVQKHRRAPPASPPAPRLPAASSPLAQAGAGEGEGGAGVLVLPPPLLLAYPPPHHRYTVVRDGEYGAVREARAGRGARGDAPPPPRTATNEPQPDTHTVSQLTCQKDRKSSSWKSFRGDADAEDDQFPHDDGPERVEVYYFERGSGEYLCACGGGGARGSACERAARRAGRAPARLLGEVLAVPRVAASVPLALAARVVRCALSVAREAAAAAVLAAADEVLKPALALVYNAALHPPLVFAGNVARGVREALRPVALAAGDALEPVARLLAALRLVHVHVQPACTCRCRCDAQQHPV